MTAAASTRTAFPPRRHTTGRRPSGGVSVSHATAVDGSEARCRLGRRQARARCDASRGLDTGRGQTDDDHRRRMVDWAAMEALYSRAGIDVIRVPIQDFDGAPSPSAPAHPYSAYPAPRRPGLGASRSASRPCLSSAPRSLSEPHTRHASRQPVVKAPKWSKRLDGQSACGQSVQVVKAHIWAKRLYGQSAKVVKAHMVKASKWSKRLYGQSAYMGKAPKWSKRLSGQSV